MPTRLRAVALYFLFVALPALGTFAVLQLGRGAAAPPSVAGHWLVEMNHDIGSALRCLNAPAGTVTLEIAQSGHHLKLSLRSGAPLLELSGELRDQTVEAASPGDRRGTPSRPTNAAVLRAVLDRHAQPHRLTGTLELPSCEAAPRVSLAAVRQPHTSSQPARFAETRAD